MEDPTEEAVADVLAAMRVAEAPRDIVGKKRRTSDFQVTAFQAAIAMPDLMDPQPSSDPSSTSASDPNTSDDTSPSSFLGTPYSTTLQFDYPFPISNAPRDPAMPPTPLPSALPIASSMGSAPSLVTAAVASEENSELASSNPLPSLLSSIAASPDLPVNNNLSDLRSLPNRSTSSLNSTHSGHTAAGMIPVMHSNASAHSVSPSSSFQSNSHVPNGSRNKGRPHSLNLSQMPPPPLSLQTNVPRAAFSPPTARRTKAQTVSSLGSTGSDMSHESNPVSAGQSRPMSGSVSSLSIASMSLLGGPGEPPMPPSLLNKLGRPRNVSTTSNSSSYFTANVNIYKSHNSREFFGSPVNEGLPSFASAPNSPPQTLGTDSSVDISKPIYSPTKPSFASSFRPQLGRSNSTTGHGLPTFNRPLFNRASTTQTVPTPAPNPVFQSRAYAQHLRHQQEQQLKLQEEQRKKAEKVEKAEKKKEKKEQKKEKKRRKSLSLSRSPSASSSSSSKTKASSQSKSPPSSSASQTDVFKLSPSQRTGSDNAIDESEDSTSPEGMRRDKPRRRSSVRRALEKTGSIMASGFRLDMNSTKRGGFHHA